MRSVPKALRSVAKPTTSLVVAAYLAVSIASSQQTSEFSPTLRLEKDVYLAGEEVRFWIGVTSQSKIPDALRTSCALHWIRPDGTRVDEHVAWPIDGDPASSWEAGQGLVNQSPSLGRYVVSFEFAGQRTPDQSFQIVANSFANSIEAHWIFVNTGSGTDVQERRLLLRVENKTGRTLRFAKPGLTGSEVWLHVKTFLPPSSNSTFVPERALLRVNEVPSFVLQKLDWDSQSRWPMVTVPPGGIFDRNVDLRSCYAFRDRQEYQVNISTVLTVFIGERDDFDARLSPLRVPVSGTAHFLSW